MKVGIFPNLKKSDTLKVIDQLFSINDNYFEFFIDDYFKNELKDKYTFGDLKSSDIVISLGGDGTLIKAMRICSPCNIPILGIHLGHLGFLVEITKDRIIEAIDKLKKSDFFIEERMMLEVQLLKDNQIMQKNIGLNDVVLTRRNTSRMICTTVNINNYLLDNYYADGIIISTPTGSTGYSLSAGGPIVDPTMNMLVVTPICSHSLYSKAVVINENKEITLIPDLEYNSDISITIDGQVNFAIDEGMVVKVIKSNISAKLVKFSECNFYELLHKKLFERGKK